LASAGLERAERKKTMKTFKKVTCMLAAIAPLAVSACTTASTSGAVGGSAPSGYTTSAPNATDAQQSGSSVPPGHYGDTFVESPEPGFNPDSIQEAP
jgi:hypothetical protein